MEPTTIASAPLIWINGFPGTGKLTVAKAMSSLDSEALVIDNHMLIDPVAHRLGPASRSHPRYQEERKIERTRAFESWVVNPACKSRTVIFTGELNPHTLVTGGTEMDFRFPVSQ